MQDILSLNPVGVRAVLRQRDGKWFILNPKGDSLNPVGVRAVLRQLSTLFAPVERLLRLNPVGVRAVLRH